jgi:hypothetical protein
MTVGLLHLSLFCEEVVTAFIQSVFAPLTVTLQRVVAVYCLHIIGSLRFGSASASLHVFFKVTRKGGSEGDDGGKQVIVQDLHEQPKAQGSGANVPPDQAPYGGKYSIWQFFCIDGQFLEELER